MSSSIIGILSMNMFFFFMKSMVRVERLIVVEWPIVVEFEADYYRKLEEVIELQYHIASII